jgi:SAM-dependent methyltransferase
MADHRAPLDYGRLAATYDRRFAYEAGERRGVAAALRALAAETKARRVLEVGCGTGRWLEILSAPDRSVWGADSSAAMLDQARSSKGLRRLVLATANALPFGSGGFDMVYCVSALHHFEDPLGFIHEARALLRPGGAVAIVGMNPHIGRDRWYLYDYFAGTRETDLRRYASPGALTDTMTAAGFELVTWRVVERLMNSKVGTDVLSEPMLQKSATSVTAALSDADYAAGRARIEAAILAAQADGREIEFPVDIWLCMVTGYLRQA